MVWINRFRTILTWLSIIIGVVSVIVMLAIGKGTEYRASAETVLTVLDAHLARLVAAVTTYRAPGGGWRLDTAAS